MAEVEVSGGLRRVLGVDGVVERQRIVVETLEAGASMARVELRYRARCPVKASAS